MKPVFLVTELHHLGDMVMAVPFLRAASSRFQVHVVCRPESAGLLEPLLPAGQIHPWNPPWEPAPDLPPGSFKKLVGALHAVGPDIAACSWPDARCGWIGLLAAATHRYGFPMNRGNYHALHLAWRRRNLRLGRLLELLALGRLYTRKLQRNNMRQHRIEDFIQLGLALGFDVDTSAPWWEPGVWPADEGLVAWKRDHPGGRVLCVAPGARLPTKAWPAPKFAATLTLLPKALRGKLRILVVHNQRTEDAVDTWPAGVEVRQTATLSQLAGVLAGSDAVLANDSFPGHFAASLGTPVLTVFGSGSPDWFRPWGLSNRIVRIDNCPFHPCIDRCQMKSPVCLEELEAPEVARQLQQFLATDAGRA